jgi:uncharacterized protein (DUF1697 family)
MSDKSEQQISPKVLSSLFARFTADRDALLTAVERCERRVVEALEIPATTAEAKADQALALAQEALELARQAMKAARQRRN